MSAEDETGRAATRSAMAGAARTAGAPLQGGAAADARGSAPARLAADCFALPPGVEWTPVDEALARLRAAMVPVTAAERLPIADAAGRILATPLVAARDNPPATNSAVDGYAFAWAALNRPEAALAIAEGRAAAGHPFEGRLARAQALRVLTGAEIPAGADTVVIDEGCEVVDGEVRFAVPAKSGANTRKRGEDARRGSQILPAGRKLTAADLARAVAVGIDAAEVRTRLRVALISTGDELIQPGAEPRPGAIYDANRPMLAALARAQGFEVVDLGAVADDPVALSRALDRGSAEADAIIATGGASAGDEDHVSRLLAERGRVDTWRIAVKPGRPLALGQWRDVPVFGLPGNPVAAFVCFLIFARPALSVMAGADWPEPQGFQVPAAFEKAKKPGRREYLRARLDANGHAEVFRSEGSGLVGGLSWATGLVELADGAAEIAPGDLVRFLPFDGFAA